MDGRRDSDLSTGRAFLKGRGVLHRITDADAITVAVRSQLGDQSCSNGRSYSHPEFRRFRQELLDDELHCGLQGDGRINGPGGDTLFIALRQMKQSLHPIALELNPDTPKIVLYDGRHLLADGMQHPQRRLGIALGGRLVDVCREAGNIAEYRRSQNALIVS